MFGFERGAFTDARRSKPGLLQAAHRGTIFLDEVGLLPEALQAKLLKVLEDRVVRRLGATRDEPVDVWIVTATNEDLATAVQQRRFREDLYHRLAVLTVALPPLRERAGDVLQLAEHFLTRTCADYGVPRKTLSADARAALVAYRWPGNVRELSNVLERAVLMSAAGEITAEGLGLPAAQAPVAAPPPAAPDRDGAGLAQRRHAGASAGGAHADQLEHLAHRRPARHLAQHAARPHGQVRPARGSPGAGAAADASRAGVRESTARRGADRSRARPPHAGCGGRAFTGASAHQRAALGAAARRPAAGRARAGRRAGCAARDGAHAGARSRQDPVVRGSGRRPRSDRCRGGLRPDGDRRRGGSRRPRRDGDRQGGRARPARGRRRDRGQGRHPRRRRAGRRRSRSGLGRARHGRAARCLADARRAAWSARRWAASW